MPVIINEFEVTVDPPRDNTTSSQPASTSSDLKPRDIERIMQHFQKRRARIHAD